MGFFGTFVVARSERPLAGLPVFGDQGLPSDWQAAGAAGWQIVQAHRNVEDGAAIADATGAPVLLMHVLDSDLLVVEAYGVPGVRWGCAIPEDMAVDYDAPEGLIADPEELTPRAVAWAEAAGLRPDAAAVRAVLDDEEAVCAEELATDLVRALGFGFPDDAELN